MTGPYDYYFARLAGEQAMPDINDPRPGFYRNRNEPVALFFEREEAREVDANGIPVAAGEYLVCVRGRRRIIDPLQIGELWPWICTYPVPEDEWRRVYDGGDWDDEAPGIGHNRAPDFLTPEQERGKLVDLAEEWMAKLPKDRSKSEDGEPVINSKRLADQAAHYITQLRNISKDLEADEADAKRPFQNFVKTLIAVYRGQRQPLDDCRAKLAALLKPYLDALDRKLEAEREAARKANEEARAAAAPGERAPAVAVPSTRVGGRGRAVSLRSYWSAEITSYPDALEAAGTEPEVRDAVQQVANRWARNSSGKTPLPGTKAVEDRR